MAESALYFMYLNLSYTVYDIDEYNIYKTFIDAYTFNTTRTEKHLLCIMHDKILVL